MLVTVILIAAVILFFLAAFGVPSKVGLSNLGLACVAAALLLG
jgi:hypothetical protein